MTTLKHAETESAIRRDAAGDRACASFLVRVWYEEREVNEGAPSFRAYIRNLQTGKERFVRDPGELGSRMVQQLEDDVSSHEVSRSQEWRVAR